MDKYVTEWQKINASAPFAFIELTASKFPKVVYMNPLAEEWIDVSHSSSWLSFVQENIFFLFPFREKEYFADCLQNTLDNDELTPLRCNITNNAGGKIPIYGWMFEHLFKGKRHLIMMFIKNPIETHF